MEKPPSGEGGIVRKKKISIVEPHWGKNPADFYKNNQGAENMRQKPRIKVRRN